MDTRDILLEIDDLHVRIEEKPILNGVNLRIRRGEVHVIMGPNGSGKSTLAYVLMGHPKYQVDSGRILFKGEEISALSPDQRARKGLFLGFQYPVAIPGVPVGKFLRTAAQAVHGKDIPVLAFHKQIKEKMKELEINDSFATRYLNDGFSGGEKKRHEILQMAVLKPEMAILDETDSGLDIDALKVVASGIEATRTQERSILLITHYQRILNYLQPDAIHVLANGRIVASGGRELAVELEAHGYDALFQRSAAAADAAGRNAP